MVSVDHDFTYVVCAVLYKYTGYIKMKIDQLQCVDCLEIKCISFQGVIIGSCFGFSLPMWMSVGSFLAIPLTPPLNASIAECEWSDSSTHRSTIIFEEVTEHE